MFKFRFMPFPLSQYNLPLPSIISSTHLRNCTFCLLVTSLWVFWILPPCCILLCINVYCLLVTFLSVSRYCFIAMSCISRYCLVLLGIQISSCCSVLLCIQVLSCCCVLLFIQVLSCCRVLGIQVFSCCHINLSIWTCIASRSLQCLEFINQPKIRCKQKVSFRAMNIAALSCHLVQSHITKSYNH